MKSKLDSVFIFTGNNCPGCDMAKKVFTEKGIPFTTGDLIENLSKAREYGFRAVPGFVVTYSDGKEVIMTGKDSIFPIVKMFTGEVDE